jgi:hypothetical protein
MTKMYQWLQDNQKKIHFILLLSSAILLVSCIGLNQNAGPGFFRFVQLFALLLLAVSVLFALSWHQYGRCEYHCKRIRYEYDRVVYRQAYKLERLSSHESAVLSHILKDRSPEEILQQMRCNHSHLYKCVGNIYRKLEITKGEDLFDIDWKNTF